MTFGTGNLPTTRFRDRANQNRWMEWGLIGYSDKQNKEIWGISEKAAARLADLGAGTGFK